MRIDRLDVHYVVMPLIYPWRTAYGEDADIHSVLVKLSSGEHGAWAESTPFFAPHYLSESAGSVFYHVTEVFGPHVVGREYDTAAEINERLSPFKGNSFAKAALEVGWWTLQSRITGTPLHRLLGGATRDVVAGADFGIQDSIEMLLGNVGQAVAAGFPRIKLKVARGWDLEMLREVTSTYPGARPSTSTATPATRSTTCRCSARSTTWDWRSSSSPCTTPTSSTHAELARRIGTPICLDETIVDPAHRGSRRSASAPAATSTSSRRAWAGCRTRWPSTTWRAMPAFRSGIGGMLESSVGGAVCIELAHPRQRHLPRRPVPVVPLLYPGLGHAAAEIRCAAHLPSVRDRAAGAGPGDAGHVDAPTRCRNGGYGAISVRTAP